MVTVPRWSLFDVQPMLERSCSKIWFSNVDLSNIALHHIFQCCAFSNCSWRDLLLEDWWTHHDACGMRRDFCRVIVIEDRKGDFHRRWRNFQMHLEGDSSSSFSVLRGHIDPRYLQIRTYKKDRFKVRWVLWECHVKVLRKTREWKGRVFEVTVSKRGKPHEWTWYGCRENEEK